MKHTEMNEGQIIGFWTWYNTGFNGCGERSFVKAAARLRKDRDTIANWYEKFNWKELAAEQDFKVNKAIEERFIRKAVRKYEQVIERQQDMLDLLYRRFQECIERAPVSQFRIADLVSLMEFEKSIYNDDRGKPAGNLLRVVLQMMPPEDRAKFNATVERARDSGTIPLARVGPESRN